MHIANFTPDSIKYTHVGLHGTIVPEQVIEVDAAKGNHILNKWGDRGLLQLQFGDEQNLDPLKAKAMEVYTDFWMKNITNFNQFNERMKNENKAFVEAQPELQSKAKELGITLIGPWKLAPPAQEKELKEAKEEVARLTKDFGDLKDTVNTLVAALTQQNTPAPGSAQAQVQEDPLREFTKQFLHRSKANLKVWAKMDKETIKTWPEEVLKELHIKWITTYGDSPSKEDEQYPF